MITVVVEIIIMCDNCLDEIVVPNQIPTYTWALRWARKEGWSIGKWDLCPKCRKSPRKVKKNA